MWQRVDQGPGKPPYYVHSTTNVVTWDLPHGETAVPFQSAQTAQPQQWPQQQQQQQQQYTQLQQQQQQQHQHQHHQQWGAQQQQQQRWGAQHLQHHQQVPHGQWQQTGSRGQHPPPQQVAWQQQQQQRQQPQPQHQQQMPQQALQQVPQRMPAPQQQQQHFPQGGTQALAAHQQQAWQPQQQQGAQQQQGVLQPPSTSDYAAASGAPMHFAPPHQQRQHAMRQPHPPHQPRPAAPSRARLPHQARSPWGAPAARAQAPSGGGVAHEWPPALKGYLKRAYQVVSTANRAKLELELREMIDAAVKEKVLWEIDWIGRTLPPAAVASQVAAAATASPSSTRKGRARGKKRSRWGGDAAAAAAPKGPPTEEDLRRAKRMQRFDNSRSRSVSKPRKLHSHAQSNGAPPVPIVGTCTDLEKSYFRLTSEPDPATVRSAAVLVRALAAFQKKCVQRPPCARALARFRVALPPLPPPSPSPCVSQLERSYAYSRAYPLLLFSKTSAAFTLRPQTFFLPLL